MGGDQAARLAGGGCGDPGRGHPDRGRRPRLGGAATEARQLGPVIGFLAAILVLAHLCDDDGLFRACGGWMARTSAGKKATRRLLAQVFLLAAVTTAVLSLDATVVLLTPVVFATAARLDVRARPHVYACTHRANSASLLLPVSNLTNLLASRPAGWPSATSPR